ncbi:MAG: DinB family protein [Sphingobacteriaceae bacterium]|nr:MAG: DinB family protein [Sphingobacteriaceae bacterium]
MKIDKKILLRELIQKVEENINVLTQLEEISNKQLTVTPANGGWSIAQVIEHLNTYNAFYMPAIEQALKQAVIDKNYNIFKPGILGNYFVKMMQPQNGQVTKKYKAATRHIPGNAINAIVVLEIYLKGQQHLLQLLEIAAKYNINNIKIPTSISSIIKLKLGDVFRFLIVHQQRHFVQIEGILKANKPQLV